MTLPETITSFDVADYLQTEEDIRQFLNEAAQSGDSRDFIHALNTAARAKGMVEVARLAGVTRASLYKSLADDGNPGFDTVWRVCLALGVKLTAQPANKQAMTV